MEVLAKSLTLHNGYNHALQHKLGSLEVWAYDHLVHVAPIPLEVGLERVWLRQEPRPVA